eukprot:scaffold58_cov28-Tisochrysis_lutea.AAC.2
MSVAFVAPFPVHSAAAGDLPPPPATMNRSPRKAGQGLPGPGPSKAPSEDARGYSLHLNHSHGNPHAECRIAISRQHFCTAAPPLPFMITK